MSAKRTKFKVERGHGKRTDKSEPRAVVKRLARKFRRIADRESEGSPDDCYDYEGAYLAAIDRDLAALAAGTCDEPEAPRALALLLDNAERVVSRG